jgi:hypothetical protein
MKKSLLLLTLFFAMQATAKDNVRKYILYNQTPFSVSATYPVQQKGFQAGTDRIAPDTAGNIGTWTVVEPGEVIINLSIFRLPNPVDIRISTAKRKLKGLKLSSVFSFRLPGSRRYVSWGKLKSKSRTNVGKVGNKDIFLETVRGQKDGQVSFYLKD